WRLELHGPADAKDNLVMLFVRDALAQRNPPFEIRRHHREPLPPSSPSQYAVGKKAPFLCLASA
ncbi:MAG: hypothetical protein M3495_13740, partial [Pseudomonadota bacterium]|nr:hypothetical protein [Pseudomonadota bacterium]